MKKITDLLKQRDIDTRWKEGILIAQVSDQDTGLAVANQILLSTVTTASVLLLSGGRTPWALYETIAKEKKLLPGAVGMIDERFGEKWHENSNEGKLRQTGLLDYYQYTSILVYLILQKGLSRKETAIAYDRTVRKLRERYRTMIGILGVGLDGHTAGIPAGNSEFRMKHSELVSEYHDTSGKYGERVTMTFSGLELLDLNLLLVFGADKKEALMKTFSDGPESAVPARFYKRPENAEKTLLITDQKV